MSAEDRKTTVLGNAPWQEAGASVPLMALDSGEVLSVNAYVPVGAEAEVIGPAVAVWWGGERVSAVPVEVKVGKKGWVNVAHIGEACPCGGEHAKEGHDEAMLGLPQAEWKHRQTQFLAMTEMMKVPGWEGSVGPFEGEYGRPHVYARDVRSGADLGHRMHVQAAPGVPVPERLRSVGEGR